MYRRLNVLKEAAAGRRPWAEQLQKTVRAEFDALLDRHGVLALPVLAGVAPEPPGGDDDLLLTMLTGPVNVAGLPAFALPVPLPGSHLPASVQLIGPAGGEERLCAVAAALEEALA
jgi:amidase